MKILFLSHSANRSGAPILLLHFLKWLKNNTNYTFELLCAHPGPLVNDYASLCKVHVWNKHKKGYSWIKQPYKRLKSYLAFDEKEELIKYIKAADFDLVYGNTVAVSDLYNKIEPSIKGLPFVCHVHELKYAIWTNGQDQFLLLKEKVSKYIAVSASVKNNLLKNYGISPEDIEVVHAFVPDKLEEHRPNKTVDQLRLELGISPNAVIVGFSGTIEWRKGTDLLLPLVQECIKNEKIENIVFLWLGGVSGSESMYQLNFDIEKLGLQHIVRILPSVSNPVSYFELFDIFVLLSREDPFPLVCLEAAVLGKPLVCFAESGGIPELIEEDGGFVVPYLDLQQLASRIIMLVKEPFLRRSLGDKVKTKVIERYTVDIQSVKMKNILEGLRRFK